eukprot:Rmarinus@m.4764
MTDPDERGGVLPSLDLKSIPKGRRGSDGSRAGSLTPDPYHAPKTVVGSMHGKTTPDVLQVQIEENLPNSPAKPAMLAPLESGEFSPATPVTTVPYPPSPPNALISIPSPTKNIKGTPGDGKRKTESRCQEFPSEQLQRYRSQAKMYKTQLQESNARIRALEYALEMQEVEYRKGMQSMQAQYADVLRDYRKEERRRVETDNLVRSLRKQIEKLAQELKKSQKQCETIEADRNYWRSRLTVVNRRYQATKEALDRDRDRLSGLTEGVHLQNIEHSQLVANVHQIKRKNNDLIAKHKETVETRNALLALSMELKRRNEYLVWRAAAALDAKKKFFEMCKVKQTDTIQENEATSSVPASPAIGDPIFMQAPPWAAKLGISANMAMAGVAGSFRGLRAARRDGDMDSLDGSSRRLSDVTPAPHGARGGNLVLRVPAGTGSHPGGTLEEFVPPVVKTRAEISVLSQPPPDFGVPKGPEQKRDAERQLVAQAVAMYRSRLVNCFFPQLKPGPNTDTLTDPLDEDPLCFDLIRPRNVLTQQHQANSTTTSQMTNTMSTSAPSRLHGSIPRNTSQQQHHQQIPGAGSNEPATSNTQDSNPIQLPPSQGAAGHLPDQHTQANADARQRETLSGALQETSKVGVVHPPNIHAGDDGKGLTLQHPQAQPPPAQRREAQLADSTRKGLLFRYPHPAVLQCLMAYPLGTSLSEVLLAAAHSSGMLEPSHPHDLCTPAAGVAVAAAVAAKTVAVGIPDQNGNAESGTCGELIGAQTAATEPDREGDEIGAGEELRTDLSDQNNTSTAQLESDPLIKNTVTATMTTTTTTTTTTTVVSSETPLPEKGGTDSGKATKSDNSEDGGRRQVEVGAMDMEQLVHIVHTVREGSGGEVVRVATAVCPVCAFAMAIHCNPNLDLPAASDETEPRLAALRKNIILRQRGAQRKLFRRESGDDHMTDPPVLASAVAHESVGRMTTTDADTPGNRSLASDPADPESLDLPPAASPPALSPFSTPPRTREPDLVSLYGAGAGAGSGAFVYNTPPHGNVIAGKIRSISTGHPEFHQQQTPPRVQENVPNTEGYHTYELDPKPLKSNISMMFPTRADLFETSLDARGNLSPIASITPHSVGDAPGTFPSVPSLPAEAPWSRLGQQKQQ